ncbi:MAG: baseplate J/gp47 family protein [Deltaproteobacteria bacterium]|nr:baseplate J/gp47 family protein [Deltaproteobacteria bacterium]
MAFSRPTLQTILDRIKGDLKAELSITAILRRSFLSAMARAMAGATHILHGHLNFISKQIFPDQAEQEYLERWAGIYGVERKAATFTQLNIDIVFTAVATAVAGTSFKRSDGEIYTLNADVTSTGAETLSGTVTAENSGSDTNTDDSEIITLESPISGVDSEATVTSTAVEGEATETDESLRARVVARIQNPPAGGTAADYINEMLGVAGVTRAWVTPGGLGEGTVLCYFVQDEDLDIIPGAAEIATVQEAIDIFKPVTADAIVVAPVERTLDMSIALSPNTQAVRDAVTEEITDVVFRESQVSGSYKEVGAVFDGTVLISKLNEAISIAAGEEDHSIISPTDDIEAQFGEIVVLGTITFSNLV